MTGAGTPPVTITSTLQAIWEDAGEPALVAALTAWWPPLGAVFNLPVIGPLLNWILKRTVDGLIAKGVIDLKVSVINFLSSTAQAEWAEEIKIIKQANDAGETLTPEQKAAFDAALQAIGANHPGVVNG